MLLLIFHSLLPSLLLLLNFLDARTSTLTAHMLCTFLEDPVLEREEMLYTGVNDKCHQSSYHTDHTHQDPEHGFYVIIGLNTHINTQKKIKHDKYSQL